MNPLLARRVLQVLTGVLAGLAVVSVLYLGLPGPWRGDATDPAGPVQASLEDPLVPEPFEAPRLDLTTLDDHPFSRDDLLGRVSVVFFGFANCPDVCPLTLQKWGDALETLEEDGLSFQGVFVSVDPFRDTPEALRGYMARFDPSITTLTGSPEALERVTLDWGVHVRFADADPGGHDGHDHGAQEPVSASERGGGWDRVPEGDRYTVEHSTRSFVVDRGGRVVESLGAYLTGAEIAAALRPYLLEAQR
jgi:protein SCO1